MEKPQPPLDGITHKNLENLDKWTKNGALLFSTMLFAGFLAPLLKSSMLLGSSAVVWPWQIIGLGAGETITVLAMATVSDGESMFLWGILPLISGCIIFVSAKRLKLTGRIFGMIVTGGAMLILLMVVFVKEAEILGLIFVPPTAAGGWAMIAIIVSGVSIATANHLGKIYKNFQIIRILSGIGGFFLALGMSIQLFAASGAWKGWSMILLYLGMIFFGVSGVMAALKGDFDESKTSFMSFALRAILLWAPFACLFAQKWSSDEYSAYVISAGGGLPHIFSSVLKCFLIYYSSAFLMAMGLCASIELILINEEENEK